MCVWGGVHRFSFDHEVMASVDAGELDEVISLTDFQGCTFLPAPLSLDLSLSFILGWCRGIG